MQAKGRAAARPAGRGRARRRRGPRRTRRHPSPPPRGAASLAAAARAGRHPRAVRAGDRASPERGAGAGGRALPSRTREFRRTERGPGRQAVSRAAVHCRRPQGATRWRERVRPIGTEPGPACAAERRPPRRPPPPQPASLPARTRAPARACRWRGRACRVRRSSAPGGGRPPRCPAGCAAARPAR
eukprot:scaffold13603_cov112-Isochrysis_galbana.AAC.11